VTSNINQEADRYPVVSCSYLVIQSPFSCLDIEDSASTKLLVLMFFVA